MERNFEECTEKGEQKDDSGLDDLPKLPGLTEEIVIVGASSRANLEDVALPRRAGYTKQGELRCFAFQITSTNMPAYFYTILITATIERVESRDDVLASCSCPFNSNGWCKHIVRCLRLIVDPDPVPTIDEPIDKPAKKIRRPPRSQRLKCARCGRDYESARNRRGSCKRRHPASCIRPKSCQRCGQDPSVVPMCFVGTHSPELSTVDAEGWPSDDEHDSDVVEELPTSQALEPAPWDERAHYQQPVLPCNSADELPVHRSLPDEQLENDQSSLKASDACAS